MEFNLNDFLQLDTTALLAVNNGGSGGVEKTTGTSASNVMSQFGYDSFYYKQIN